MERTVYSSSAGLLNRASWFYTPQPAIAQTLPLQLKRPDEGGAAKPLRSQDSKASKAESMFSTIGNPARSASRESDLVEKMK